MGTQKLQALEIKNSLLSERNWIDKLFTVLADVSLTL